MSNDLTTSQGLVGVSGLVLYTEKKKKKKEKLIEVEMHRADRKIARPFFSFASLARRPAFFLSSFSLCCKMDLREAEEKRKRENGISAGWIFEWG